METFRESLMTRIAYGFALWFLMMSWITCGAGLDTRFKMVEATIAYLLPVFVACAVVIAGGVLKTIKNA